jgi:hypothetical protein
LINAKIYQATEKMFMQHIACELGLEHVSCLRTLEMRLCPLMKTNKFRCVFVVTNAEELAGFNTLVIQQFLRFVSAVRTHEN